MRYDVVAVASPADGTGILRRIFAELPDHFPVPVVCLQPFVSGVRLEDIIPAASPLCARLAREDEPVQGGCVVFAPGACALAVRPDRTLEITPCPPGARIAGAVDRFFASVASAYGGGTLAVLLAGWGSDGFEGARAVRDAGGSVIVQSQVGMGFGDVTKVLARTGIADEVVEGHLIAGAITRRLYAMAGAASRAPASSLRPG